MENNEFKDLFALLNHRSPDAEGRQSSVAELESRISQEELQRLVDGALNEDERRVLCKKLQSEPDAIERLATLIKAQRVS